MSRKADELAQSKGSTANTVKAGRERMEAAKNVGRDSHNRSGKYDGTEGHRTDYGSSPKATVNTYAPREGKKRKHYGKPFNEE